MSKVLGIVCGLLALVGSPAHAEASRIKVLFLGDNGHHKPIERASDILAPLAHAGIDMVYTDDLHDLNDKNLARYDGLIIYANHTKISPKQEKALLDFVENGKGLIALHCASYCFLNSPKYISLVGGQFESHKTGVFRTRIVDAKHPAMKGVEEFEAWDETYKHHRLTGDRHVLMVREEGDKKEPWTWVRTQGKGHVFYTASGHDERVFRNPAYHNLVIQGIRWAVGRPDHEYKLKPFEYQEGELPNYRAGRGARLHKMQKPLSPTESMKHLSVPGGFRVELFASEPDIVKPIAINWDARGRAWIAETLDYPNNKQPDGQGHDRILIAEDTNGDGKADKFTVFADKLSIPTSMVLAGGGLIVAQAPHMLFLKDTDGDDKADVRKVLFTGFRTNDTHAGPSNLRLGLDNWIYATVGYAGFEGEVGGKRYRFGQGIFRFKADGSELEFLGSTTNNTWGLGLGETGEIFYSTANGEHSSYLAIPNRYFESVRGLLGKGTIRMADYSKFHPITAIRQVDFHDGFTAAAGHALYTARQFPPSYWNRVALVAEPTGHLVAMCLLDKQGSNFVTHDRFNLLASSDEWTAPIAAEVGPDGAVWVLDWYNYIVQHNPTPPGFETGKGAAYDTPLRDKKHGRIYRIINETPKAPVTINLDAATPAQLVAALKNDNMFWRLQAQRRLVDRGNRDVLPGLAELVGNAGSENLAAIHALHTMNGLGAFANADVKTKQLLYNNLKHASVGVRHAALAVLPRTEESVQAILAADLLKDDEPLVRRAALLALSEMPAKKDAGAAVHALLMVPENEKDRWILLAATSAAARHDTGFLAAALAEKKNTEAVRRVVRIVAQHYARGDAIASLGDLLIRLKDANVADADVLLEGLAAGWPKGNTPKLDDSTRDALVALMPRLGANGQLHLATLAGRWGLAPRFEKALAGLRKTLLAVVADEMRSEKERIESAQRLAQMQPDATVLESLLAEVSPKASPALSSGILDAAGQATSPELARLLVERWNQFTPRVRQQAAAILLRRPEWSTALLDALDKGTVPATDLSLDQSQQLTNHPDKKLADRARAILARGGRLPSPDRQKVLDEYTPLVEKTGDARKGFEVFKNICAKCHRHGETGETIAPNLTGFNVHPKSKILQKMLDPNRSVEGNFRQYSVTTKAGRVFVGLLASETKTAIELVDTEAKRHVILREDIEEMLASNRTIMPEGFEKQLSKDDFVNVLEFLTAKGKYVPIPLDKVATVVSTEGMFYSSDSTLERLIFPDWKPKTFNGVPFQLIDPQGRRVKNVILLHSNNGTIPPKMPRSVVLPCNTAARAIHFLSGVGGWSFPGGEKGSVSMIVRLHYADGKTEDHSLKNGEQFADYIRRVDVPGSQFAFALRGQQIRYLTVTPERAETIKEIELLKGTDRTAPVVMAMTVETK